MSEDKPKEDEFKFKKEQYPPLKTDKAIDVESEPATPVNPRMKFYADKLEDEAGETTFGNYKELVKSDDWPMDGVLLKANKLKPDEIGRLRKLTAEIPKIDQETEWDKYLANMRAQGKLLIENLTDEIFDNSDFYVLENVITAWRMKHRGFRKLQRPSDPLV